MALILSKDTRTGSGAGSTAVAQPLLPFPGSVALSPGASLPGAAGTAVPEEPLLRAAVILGMRKGLELLQHEGEDVHSLQLPDFSAQPVLHSSGLLAPKLPLKLLYKKAFYLYSFCLLELLYWWEPSGAQTWRN